MNEHSQRFYDFGPFVVDVGKRLLLRANEPVPLAPKVLETLLALIENRERVLSKDELLTLVWGDTVVEEGGLTRNVSMLRKALGEKPEDHQYIVTVPARGYRFVAEVRERWRNGDAATTDVPAPLKPDGSLWVRSARRWIGLGLAVLTLGFLTYVVLRPAPVPDQSQSPAQIDSVATEDLLLRARYLSVRTTDADTQAAIALLQQAIALNPRFAVAYADLAAAYVTRLTFVASEETGNLEQKAFAAAEKALALDPNLAEAYMARGDLLWTHSQRFAHERAAQEFRRAVNLKPRSDQAHRRLARLYVHLGFFEKALEHADIALAINPSNAQALNSRAQALLWMGQDEEALTVLSSIPGPVLPELVEANTAFVLLRLGRQKEAWAQLERALHTFPNDPSGALSGIEAVLLARSEPLRALALIEKVANRRAVNPSHHAAYFAAIAWGQMGRAAEAVQYLREAADTGFPCYPLFVRDPTLDPIRQDPGFRAFLADMHTRWVSLRHALFDQS